MKIMHTTKVTIRVLLFINEYINIHLLNFHELCKKSPIQIH